MKKVLSIALLLCFCCLGAVAQELSLSKGWKFKQGDSLQWASTQLNDSNWNSIDVARDWESQGFANYDGFGWYRLHVVIPTSLKESSYLKDSLRLELHNVDDNDEVYLNGKLIGKYGGSGTDIKESKYGPRTYLIAANNPAILWDKENVIAIRIFDTGGAGGLYGDKFSISMNDVMDYVNINTDGDFSYGPKSSLGKSVKLVTTGNYNYKGKLNFKVTDPETGSVIYEKTNDADFAAGKPFTYTFTIGELQKKSYDISYTFTDEASGTKISKTESTPYVLTPYPSSRPKINGADVFGARPGNPFLYRIPATGKAPLAYKAEGLPDGLNLDAVTGIITGTVNTKGDYPVTLTVSNSIGSRTKQFTISIGDNIGLTPALGWNSWNAWGLSVDDKKVRISAKAMADKLASHGWAYINIDDGWEADNRRADGEIATNSKFPDMKALADYVHGLGLKIGIYSSPGPRTCGGYLGSWQHEDQDAKTYGDWGIDYLKYDWCSYSEVTAKNPTLADMKKPYQVMRSALDKINRDIMFSFCQYGMGKVWEWGAEVGGNSWRTTGDIQDTWQSMSGIGFGQAAAAPYAQPGHFNDPDMLVVGKVGWGPNLHNTRLTYDEQYTHISLWCLQAVPLLIGCDMSRLDKFTLNLLTNDEVLAIDQDALGKSALPVIKKDGYEVWIKEMKDGSKAIGIFNKSDKYQTISLNREEAGIAGYKRIRDVWQQKYIINSGPDFKTSVAPHGVMLVRAYK
ncbi:putative Ig domain-containing protein [Mucilaginibacter segetis]|uniref:Alpha-galactosidase n=1 Tax=Mucilaginibacter segetis TaxID=2793071 RepID=A0A934PQA9_9SPHI|nr:putative Ig domain-containing protein [Mucilaginibacter segetis]MBK0377732.1 putative Ig domain-containing protein [Mucilaginibacter segetis]